MREIILITSNIVDTNTFEPLPWQIEPWKDMSPIMLLSSGSGTGKSMPADTRIAMFDGSVKNLVDVIPGDKVMSFAKDGSYRAGNVLLTEYSGKKKIVKVRTLSGKVIRLSPDHPLRVGSLYKKASLLRVGDYLSTAKKTGFGTGYAVWEEAVLIAYIISGGDTTGGTVRFETFDDEAMFEFTQAVEGLGDKILLSATRPFRRFEVEVDGENVKALLHKHGLMGKTNKSMHIPDFVFNLDADLLSQFINRMFAVSGWVLATTKLRYAIRYGFSTTSESVSSDLSLLLQKYGIETRTRIVKKFNDTAYATSILGASNIILFYDNIGPMLIHDDKYQEAYSLSLESEKKYGISVIPKPVLDYATVLMPIFQRDKRFDRLRKILRTTEIKYVMRDTVNRWIDTGEIVTRDLIQVLHNDIIYDEITAITMSDEEVDMYDIQVQEYENYCAQGVDSHNSRLAAEKIHAFLLEYPGATGLVVRKTRASMENSTIAFFKHTVIGKTPGIIYRPQSFRFDYPNGSALVMGGMKDEDQREHIRSIGQNGAVDIAWMEEATQFQENDYNEILARMRGVAGPFTQVILTTNPEGPMHWIYTNLIMDAHQDSRISLYQPSVYDNQHNSKEYISNNLERLSGVQRARLLEGRWVQATGLVFDNWRDDPDSDDTNVTYDADYVPGGGKVVWWVDDGVTGEMKNGVFTAASHPRAILFVQHALDGKLNIFDEDYKVGKVAVDHLEEMFKYSESCGYDLPSYILRDRAAASLGAAIRETGFADKWNPVRVEESITEMYSWIDPGDANIRRLRAHPRCKHFRNEMVNFGRNSKTGRIVKAYDHGVDAARYGVWDNVEGQPAEIDVANYYQDNYVDLRTLGVYGRSSRRKSGIDIATY